MTTTPHDATKYTNPAQESPAGTAVNNAVVVELTAESYHRSFDSTVSQYEWLTGTGPGEGEGFSLDSLEPDTVQRAGEAFTLTLLGSGFTEGSQVYLQGVAPLDTVFVDENTLTTEITPVVISAQGVQTFEVRDGENTSEVLPLTIVDIPQTVEETKPSSSWLKADIQEWLTDHGIDFYPTDTKDELLALIPE